MSGLTDDEKAKVLEVTEKRFGKLLENHPEIKSVNSDLVIAIFLAGIEAGSSSLATVVK